MNLFARVSIILVLSFGGISSPAFAADPECNYNWMLANDDGSKATAAQYAEKDRREAECRRNLADQKQRAANARARLKGEFKVDAGTMSDSEAIARLQEEVDRRAEAQNDASERRAEAAEQKRMEQASSMLDKQDRMLKGQGVNMKTSAADELDEDEIDPTELQMYQRMVDQGAAPQCKGRKGEALITCVDAALDEEE